MQMSQHIHQLNLMPTFGSFLLVCIWIGLHLPFMADFDVI